MSRLGVVTVTYGSPELLDDHLAVADLPAGTFVVVVDNLATPAARAAIRDRCERHGWEFVAMPGNPGFGAACNRGAGRAWEQGCDVVLLLNPDARPEPGTAAALADACRAASPAMAAPAVRGADGRLRVNWGRLDPVSGRNRPGFGFAPAGGQPTGAGTVDGWLGGACLAVDRAAWDAAGGFAEDYFMYWEDVDFSRRAVGAGVTLLERLDLAVRHDAGGTQGTAGTKSPFYVYWNCRNRLLFARKHLDARGRWNWLLRTPRESVRIAERAGRRQLLKSPSLQWATIRGTVAGLRVALVGRR